MHPKSGEEHAGADSSRCIIACESPAFVRSVIQSLKSLIDSKEVEFAWSCTFSVIPAESDSDVVRPDALEGVAAIHRPSDSGSRSRGMLLLLFSRHPSKRDSFVASAPRRLNEITAVSAADGRVTMRIAEETLLVQFPTADLANRFLAVAEQVSSGDDGDSSTTNPQRNAQGDERRSRSSSITSTNTARRSETGGDSTRTLGHKKADDGGAVLLRSADTDYFHAGSHKGFCTRARHKWGKLTSKLRSLGREAQQWHIEDESSRDKGLQSVLLSVDAQLEKSTHEVAVVTDVAIFIVKRRDPGVVKAFLPIAGIERLRLISGHKTSASGDAVVEWEVLVVLDLQFPVSTMSTDMRLIMDNRNKNLLVAALSRQYEALRLARLPQTMQQDVLDKFLYRKRTFLETKVIRFANKLKSGFDSVINGQDDGHSSSEHEKIAVTVRDTVMDHTDSFVESLCSYFTTKREDMDSLSFMARSLWSVAKRCGATKHVLASAVCFEVRRVDSFITKTAQGSLKGALDMRGFFRGRGFADALVNEFLVNVGEQYLRIQLAQMLEEFVLSTTTSPEWLSDNELLKWVTDFCDVVCGGEHLDALFPEPFREILLLIDAVCSGPEIDKAPNGTASRQLRQHLAQDFVAQAFLCKALQAPQSHGLVSQELTFAQVRNLRVIATLFHKMINSGLDAELESSPIFSLDEIGGASSAHDPVAQLAERLMSKSDFRDRAGQIREKFSDYVKRILSSAPNHRKDILGLIKRMQSPQAASSVKTPLLESDVRVFRMFHSLLEHHAVGVMAEGYRLILLPMSRPSTVNSEPENNFALMSTPAARRNSRAGAASAKLASPATTTTTTSSRDKLLQERLANSDATIQRLQRQCTSALEALHEAQSSAAAKDLELKRMRKVLLDMNSDFVVASYLDQPEVDSAHADMSRNAWMLQEGSPVRSTSAFAWSTSGVGSKSVFGCPMDHFLSVVGGAPTDEDRSGYSPLDTQFRL